MFCLLCLLVKHVGYLLRGWLLMMCCLSANVLAISLQETNLQQAKHFSQSQPLAELIPRANFDFEPSVQHPTLSPNGQFVSYLRRLEKHTELWLFDIKKNQHRRLLSHKKLQQSKWAKNSEMLFVVTKDSIITTALHKQAIAKILVNLDEEQDEYFYAVDSTHQQAIIVSKKLPNNKTNDAQHQLIRVKAQGQQQLLLQTKDRVLDYILSPKGEPWFITQQIDNIKTIFDLRQAEKTPVLQCQWYSRCALQHYHAKNNSLLLRGALEADLSGLYAYSLTSQKLSLIHQDPQQKFDISRVYYDEKQQPKLAIYEDQYVSYYGLDLSTQQLLSQLQSRLTRQYGADVKWQFKPNSNFTMWLIRDISANQPDPKAFVYDAKQAKLQPLFDITEPSTPLGKQQALLVKKVAIEYLTSDGMRQMGYVSLPLGMDPAKVPLVVKVHGGPWSRVTGGHDSITQFIVNRGYAVFEPNFRASIGMGKNYVLSAKGDFGNGRVQQDIIDGMHYVLSQGIGDKNKLAIYGHSFGGFSTLTALAFTPRLFKVGIAGAPPTDMAQSVKLLMKNQVNDADILQRSTIHKLALDPNDAQDMARFYKKSPAAHWQKITRPLYIIAGERDPKVAVARVKDFSVKLKQAGKAISLLVDKKAGHSPKRAMARQGYFYLLEKALADHLGGKMQHKVSTKLERYLTRNLLIDNNSVLAATST